MMNFKILKVKTDLRAVAASSELRNAVLERYESYLSHQDEEDELTTEIRRDIEEGCILSLNAYAAQSFVQDIEESLTSKKGSMFKAIKRFYADSGIYKEVEEGVEVLVFSSNGKASKAKPDFKVDGKSYIFDRWITIDQLDEFDK